MCFFFFTADDPTRERSFRQPSTAGIERQKLLRNMRKKLQQMDGLQALRADGHQLDVQQLAKLTHKALVERIIAAIESDAPMSVIEPLVAELRGGADAEAGGQANPIGRSKGATKHAKSISPVAAVPTTVAESLLALPEAADVKERSAPAAATGEQPPVVQPSPVKHSAADWDNLVLVSPKEPRQSPRQQRGGGKAKRGALSLSLVGASASIEAATAEQATPPANKAPAWGRTAMGAPLATASLSLKAILAQQAAEQPSTAGSKPVDKPPRPGQTGVALSLGELIDAKVERQAVAQPKAVAQPIAAKKHGPAWGCAGGSPPPGLSFADIQVRVYMLAECYCWCYLLVNDRETTSEWNNVKQNNPQAQQEQQRIAAAAARSWGSSPTTRVTWRAPAKASTAKVALPGDAFVPLGASPGAKAGTGSHNTSRWYVPHQQEVVPLRIIQSEQGQGDASVTAVRAWGRAQ